MKIGPFRGSFDPLLGRVFAGAVRGWHVLLRLHASLRGGARTWTWGMKVEAQIRQLCTWFLCC